MPRTTSPGTLRLPTNRRAVPTRTRLRTRRVPLVAYALLLLALPVAVILGSQATGWWLTDGRSVTTSALGAEALGVAQVGGDEARTAPITGPGDVKGSMTLQQVLDAFPQVTAADVCDQFGVPADTPASTQLKTLAAEGNGYEVADLRAWLATRQPTG